MIWKSSKMCMMSGICKLFFVTHSIVVLRSSNIWHFKRVIRRMYCHDTKSPSHIGLGHSATHPKKFAALVLTDKTFRHRNANWRTRRLNHGLQTNISWVLENLGGSLSKDRKENLESGCLLLYSLDGGLFVVRHHRKNLLPNLITLQLKSIVIVVFIRY